MSRRYWEWSSPFQINPNECAFLIVDMQKGFVDKGACLEVPMARKTVPVIAEFANFCREKGIPVLYSRFVFSKDYTYRFYWNMREERGLLNPDGSNKFSLESNESEITDALKPCKGDIVFDKCGYSCFPRSILSEELKKRNVKTLIIAGTVINWCVDSTVRDAYHRDYNVVLMADGVSGYDQAGITGEKWCEIELDHIAEAFARVAKMRNIEEEISLHS